MTSKKDAGELLHYFSKIHHQTISAKNLLKETRWGSWRLERAIRYLRATNAIEIILSKEKIERLHLFVVTGLTKTGQEIIENKDKFRDVFGFDNDLNAKKWSWQISK